MVTDPVAMDTSSIAMVTNPIANPIAMVTINPTPSLQEQSMMCRGGLLWYMDIVVFPCRVQEKYEEV